MIGPPGAGKTMLARRLPTILPPLSLEEALDTTMIHSVAGKLDRKEALITRRPFRDPHHTISNVAVMYNVENCNYHLSRFQGELRGVLINFEIVQIFSGDR